MEELNWIKSSNGEFEDIIIEEDGDFNDIVVEDTMGEEEVIEQVNQQTSRQKKRGVPWIMEEHWTPTQVASHAQKFFKRMQKTAAEKCWVPLGGEIALISRADSLEWRVFNPTLSLSIASDVKLVSELCLHVGKVCVILS
ncbi:hypothetical protein AgCh_029740 [Apium graveolens]